MHCEDTKDPDAVWNESWRALEKAYAEGRLMSIGVSNFNETLLNEINSFSSIRPHVVQNWAEVGHVDDEVRSWCFKNDAVYQPYASIRNLHQMEPEAHAKLIEVAQSKKLSPHAASLRFFLQTGAALIPRSSNEEHLRDNLNIVTIDDFTPEEMSSLGWHISEEEEEAGEEGEAGEHEVVGEEEEEEEEEEEL